MYLVFGPDHSVFRVRTKRAVGVTVAVAEAKAIAEAIHAETSQQEITEAEPELGA